MVEAIKEWGSCKSNITYIVFATTSGVNMLGTHHMLTKLLSLTPSVKRVMMYQTDCFDTASVLRVAKDLAENNKETRVLAVCSEFAAVTYCAPSENHLDGLMGSALFGGGAGTLVVESNSKLVEKPLFKVHWAGKTIVSKSDSAIEGHLTEAGFIYLQAKEVSTLVLKNIEKVLTEAQVHRVAAVERHVLGGAPWRPCHLGSSGGQLQLSKEKLQGSRDILVEFGNMSSTSVLFVLDQIRQRSVKMGSSTLGEGSDFGFFIGFGLGLTMEVLVFRAVPNIATISYS